MTGARLFVAALILCSACRAQDTAPAESYIYVWAGDSAGTSSDFLAVIDASPSSARYGTVVASVPTGVAGAHPHHTEPEMPANGHLLANGFHAGRTWLFDLSEPRSPKVLTTFAAVDGFSHPHSYFRMPNGNVLTTFQYRADGASADPGHAHEGKAAEDMMETGGLVEMDERGTVLRSRSAADVRIPDTHLFPYSALPISSIDRIVSTTTNMNPADTLATSQWVQFWRLSDLTLLQSIALLPGPRGDEHRFSGEARLLPDGKSVYIHTFNCGLYLIRDVASEHPVATFVKSFTGVNCGVPLLAGNYWLQTVPDAHALVSLDISDPARPREVSTLSLGAEEKPHWVGIDGSGTRVVLNSAGDGTGNRLFVIDFDPKTGALAIDERFRDAGATRPGVSFSGKSWPHGFTGKAIPHGTVFSR